MENSDFEKNSNKRKAKKFNSKGKFKKNSKPLKKKKKPSIGNLIRGIERLLKREIPQDVRKIKMQELEELKAKREEKKQEMSELMKRIKFIKTKKMVKFFERRKIVRKITQLEKKYGLNLETLSVKDLNESTELQESNDLIDAKNKLRELKLNLLYIRYFPKERPYIPLLREVDEKSKEEIEKIKKNILLDISNGIIDENSHEEKEEEKELEEELEKDEEDNEKGSEEEVRTKVSTKKEKKQNTGSIRPRVNEKNFDISKDPFFMLDPSTVEPSNSSEVNPNSLTNSNLEKILEPLLQNENSIQSKLEKNQSLPQTKEERTTSKKNNQPKKRERSNTNNGDFINDKRKTKKQKIRKKERKEDEGDSINESEQQVEVAFPSITLDAIPPPQSKQHIKFED